MNQCYHCRATTTNGLALCDLCQRFARDCLANLPIYFRNLSRQRRPGRPNGSIGGGRGSDDDTVSVIALLGRAENMISTWARALEEDRGVVFPEADTEVETFTLTCSALGTLLATIATLEWAGQFVRDVVRHEKALCEATQERIPGWYAGACRQSTGRDMEGNEHTCGTPTYVIPGLTWVTCKGCGATTYARDHLDIVLEEAREWIARPKELAEAIVALIDSEPSIARIRERIKKWDQRGKIPVHRATELNDFGTQVEVGPKRYRLGDVLDLVLARTTETTSSERIGA